MIWHFTLALMPPEAVPSMEKVHMLRRRTWQLGFGEEQNKEVIKKWNIL